MYYECHDFASELIPARMRAPLQQAIFPIVAACLAEAQLRLFAQVSLPDGAVIAHALSTQFVGDHLDEIGWVDVCRQGHIAVVGIVRHWRCVFNPTIHGQIDHHPLSRLQSDCAFSSPIRVSAYTAVFVWKLHSGHRCDGLAYSPSKPDRQTST